MASKGWCNQCNQNRLRGRERLMKGQVLDFSVPTNSGIISGSDGSRYTFSGVEWKADLPPARGMSVDFDVDGDQAIAIYRALGSTEGSGSKSKIAAGLLGIFLGGLGIHKFYLGFVGPGLVYLLTNTIGWVVTIFLLGIPNIVLGIMAFVEGIIYLTKTDEEFEQLYVVEKKQWF